MMAKIKTEKFSKQMQGYMNRKATVACCSRPLQGSGSDEMAIG